MNRITIDVYMSNKKGLYALSPLLVFMVAYLATSLAAGDFYKIFVLWALADKSDWLPCFNAGFSYVRV